MMRRPNASVETKKKVQPRGMFKEIDSILAKEGPIDSHEQEKLIIELEKLQANQAKSWLSTFGVIAFFAAAGFAYSTYSQAFHPWELRYVGEFAAVAEQQPSVVALLLQTLSLILASLSMVLDLSRTTIENSCLPPSLRQKVLAGLGLLLSSLGAAYWFQMIRLMSRELGHTGRGLLWLPIAPLGVCLACVYVIWSLNYTGKEIRRMRQLRYSHKTL